MESKKINQLATNVAPQPSDLTIIGDPITGVSKKITLEQISSLFATSGTVTSVAVTESGDALTITGSPITTAGTINIGFAGTSGQYINGTGNLTTFPSLTGFVPYTGATANVDLGTFDLTTDIINLNQLKAIGSGGLNIYSNSGTHIALMGGGGGAGTTLYGGLIGTSASFTTSGSSDTFAINHSSGSGIALNITKGGDGEGLYINKTSGSGNAATIIGTLNATTLVKSGGTSSQFLKADGSVDSSAYITLTSLSAGAGISYNNTTGAISSTITQYTDALARAAISLTTTGTSGAATYNSTTGVLNIPEYIGGVTSVFGRTGAVVATEGDYSLTQLSDVTITTPTNGQVLKYNGTAWVNDTDANTGTVTSVGLSSATSGVTIASSPITTSGTITIAIATASGSQNGLLSSTDWTTFNSKGSGTVTSVAALTLGTTGTDLSSSVANGTTTPVITLNVPTASATNRGALSSSDWTTFNNKANALSGTINTIAYWDSATTIASLALATYPSLTELSYVKGVTSAIQTQLNAKQGTLTLTTTGSSGAATLMGDTLNIPQYSGGGGGMAIGGSITSATAGSVLFAGAAGVLAQDNANFFWDDTNNRLGIGTATPLYKFDITTAASQFQTFRIQSGDDAYITFGSTIASSQYWSFGATSNTSGQGANLFIIGTSTNAAASVVQSLVINSSGNIGINTNTPNKNSVGKALTINATTGSSMLELTSANSATTTYFEYTGTNSSIINVANGYLRFGANNAEVMRITGGSVTIGNISATGSKFQVNGSAAIGYSASTAAPTNGLAVAGQGTFGDNITISKNQNAQTNLTISNTTAGTGANTALLFTSDASAGSCQVFKYGSTKTAYKVVNSNDFGHYNNGAGNIVFFNDFASGAITLTAGGASTAHLTLNSSGNLGVGTATIGSRLQVNGNAAIGYSASTAAPTNGLAVSGNVGIGTSSPTEKLDVIGGALASGNGTIRTGITYSTLGLIGTFTNHDLGIITNGTTKITIASSGAATFSSSVTASGNSLFSAGSTALTQNILTVKGGGASGAFGFRVEGNNGDAILYTNNLTYDVIANTVAGNFGIGTTTIGSKLQVNGNAAIGYSASTAAPTNGLVVAGNILAGTTSENSYGANVTSVQLNGSSGSLYETRHNGTSALRVGSSSDHCYIFEPRDVEQRFSTNGTLRMTIGNGGIVTISNLAGSGSRAVLADASGVLSAPVSDISVKENVKPIGYGLKEISKMNPVWFEFTDDYKNYGEGRQNGNIAQEMAEIIPEAVFTTPSTGKMGINYDQMHAVYIKAIQELEERIKQLENN
jgi:hypothetical protein